MNNKTKLGYYAVVVSLFFVQNVLAKEADLSDKVKACGKISQNKARLSCFDHVS